MLVLAGCGLREFENEFSSMSTYVKITAYARRAPAWDALHRATAEWVRQLDHRVEGSATAILNEKGMLPAGSEGEALLRAVLADAVRAAARTEGAYDPTILPVVRLWDFDDGGRLPSPEALASAVSLVDYTTVRVTGALALAPGQQVDLGGVGKGAVVDLVADHLAGQGIERFLVEAGGDLLVAGLKPGERPWRIWIQHPRTPEAALAILEIGAAGERRAVVTSGDYERYLEVDGVRYHHILDPKTGWPARRSVSVTVISARAAEADALATGLFVAGPAGLPWFDGDAGVQALVVTETDGELRAHATADFPVPVGELNLN
ncbi:MAG: FAD:protein FMN transferase [Spirochaetaceae bacterium]|nr:FAD:protein FMN transferase [Spirochaetaceae bacterium]MDE0220852.1 FAD:protein FMN transferase [Spirochaetaceae bacterium]